jgi:hypothetical protein
MAERDEKADREDYGDGREKYSDEQKDEVGYSHGYYGGFGREGRLFGDRTEDVSAHDSEDDSTGDEEKEGSGNP